MRYLAALGLGFVVVLGLFAVMNALVNNNRHELVEADDNRISEFIRLQRPETIKEKKREIPKPQPKRPPPPPEMKISQQVDKPVIEQVKMDVPQVDVDLDLAVGDGAGLYASGGVSAGGGPVPLNKFSPMYPRKALQSGVGGSVVFQYTVNADGRVSDVKIVKEKPRGKGFGKAIKKAALKWKFKPAMEDGVAVARTQQQEYEFVLE
ncbi:energy transducer TonB [Endozoicomonas sp. GU-1]|uniref:energy transducer TonB n=1 Tax=Endozoicomonas sp. GU-1 TaxID=3009078 RepID=UPI0022B4A92A|nr:energy transducer TonB [Endozoicomonas sp. GU-1]WBA80687.1 energy transducer TonB [Endozoicomonas sp. GU-1]WBA88253.1 energy transducer TonB [Endozoicomonas sp. GU-1]